MSLPIITYGNNVLRKTVKTVTEKSLEIDKLIQNMYNTLDKSSAVGLAAPQVDKLLSIFIVRYNGFNQVFINPEILEYSDNIKNSKEGCLSIPGFYAYVQRSHKIKIRFLDNNFIEHIGEYNGDISYIVQHELDHLKGILFIDKISNLSKKINAKKLEKIRNKKFYASYKTK